MKKLIPNPQSPIPNQIPMTKYPNFKLFGHLRIGNWSLIGHWKLVIGHLILFFVLCSLFFVAVPVFAQETTDLCAGAKCPPITKEKSALLPECVYHEGNTSKVEEALGTVEQCCGCRNVNVLVSLLTKVASWLFSIVGAVALAVFIYGGFTILTAAGSAERVKKGKDALIAAVIGLVIVFTAQVGLKFLLKVILEPTGVTAPEMAQPKEGLNLEFVKPPLPNPQEEKK